MKRFNVYKHPAYGYEAVKIGLSWPALVFGVFWMLFKRLLGFATLWCVAYIALYPIPLILSLQEEKSDQLAFAHLLLFAAYVALWLVPFFKGNKWREQNLEKRGYSFRGAVVAETPDAAVGRSASTDS